MLKKKMTFEEWNEFMAKGNFDDISEELPDIPKFPPLLQYQEMRAKIIYEGKKYYVSGWKIPNIEPFVAIKEEIKPQNNSNIIITTY